MIFIWTITLIVSLPIALIIFIIGFPLIIIGAIGQIIVGLVTSWMNYLAEQMEQ